MIYIEEQPFGYSVETDWGGAREGRCCMHRPGGGEWCLCGEGLAGSGRQSLVGLPKGQVISQAAFPSGSFSKFVNVMSARTAVGHDREGQLVLFHVDGQTEQRG